MSACGLTLLRIGEWKKQLLIQVSLYQCDGVAVKGAGLTGLCHIPGCTAG